MRRMTRPSPILSGAARLSCLRPQEYPAAVLLLREMYDRPAQREGQQ